MKVLLVLTFLFPLVAYSAINMPKRVNYKTYIGYCPSKSGGEFALHIMDKFNESQSLQQVKETIITEKLDTRYFLSEYKVNYDPLKNLMRIELDCPKPVMKVQITRDTGDEFYTAILASNGKLLDPNYEVLLRAEKKIKGKLPSLVLPVSYVDNNKIFDFIALMDNFPIETKKDISEIVVSEKSELTIILSINGRPSTAFLGENFWDEKVQKLTKVVDYMKNKRKIPSVINLTNTKKIVVKF